MNFYNDNDPYVCEWAENLIKAGLIPPGDVVCKPIEEIQPDELKQYTQCHFFNGIAGWSYALELAGWPRDVPVWTGSCPCVDFCAVGRGGGFEGDQDHWPDLYRLIKECGVECFFGEQTDDSLEWIDRTTDDLESINHTVGSVSLSSISVGANHGRERFWFASHSPGFRGTRLVEGRGAGTLGSWWPSSPQDMQGIFDAPFSQGDCWPQPLLRGMDDGLSKRVVGCHAYGNSIVPQVAAEFIKAYCEAGVSELRKIER